MRPTDATYALVSIACVGIVTGCGQQTDTTIGIPPTPEPDYPGYEAVHVGLDEVFFSRGATLKYPFSAGTLTLSSHHGMQTRMSNGNYLLSINLGDSSHFEISEVPYQGMRPINTTPLVFRSGDALFNVKHLPVANMFYGPPTGRTFLQTFDGVNNVINVGGSILTIKYDRILYDGSIVNVFSRNPMDFGAYYILAADYRNETLHLHVRASDTSSWIGVCNPQFQTRSLSCDFAKIRDQSGPGSWLIHATDDGAFLTDSVGNIDYYAFATQSLVTLSLPPRTEGVWQFYSSAEDADFVYMGHYPSADVLRCHKADLVCDFLGIGTFNTDQTHRDEAQSILKLGDTLYSGVWPWGEVFATHISNGMASSSQKVFRAFEQPALSSTELHPWRDKSDVTRHCFGQRITQLLPYGEGFIVVTGNFHNECQEILRSALTDAEYDQYGKMYLVKTDRDLTCNLEGKKLPAVLSIYTSSQRVIATLNGREICSRNIN